MDLKVIIQWLKTSRWTTPLLAGINLLLWLTDRLAVWSVGRVTIQPNTLAILKLDVLGDYLLFRPYLRYLENHPDYRGYKLTLVGNITCRGIAEQFDADVIDAFLWADIYKLATRPIYRFQFVRRLRQQGFSMAFCPTYSRVLVLDDFLTCATGAPCRVGVLGDFMARKPWEARIGDRLFNMLLNVGKGIVFEMERNRLIISELLGQPVPLLPPQFDLAKLPAATVPKPNVVLSLGAGQAARVWPTEWFAAIAKHIIAKYPDHHILLTGTSNEKSYAVALLASVPPQLRLHDLTGKLSLLELIAVLKQTDLLIANETGTVHLAASVQTPTLVISQGKSLVRWHPYPTGFAEVIDYIYPQYIEQHRDNLVAIAADFNPESPLSITELSVNQVANAVDRRLCTTR